MLFSVTPIVGVCNCSMFCCTLLYVPYSFAIILMGKRELVALLCLCLEIVVWLFFTVSWVSLQFVIILIILTIFKQNCTAQEADGHAPLIAYSRKVLH